MPHKDDSAEHSMFESMGSVNNSVSQSLRNAEHILGGLPDHVRETAAESMAQSFHSQHLLAPEHLQSLGNGKYRAEIKGADAPIQARIISSMLDGAGAQEIGKAQGKSQPTDRIVTFRLPPGEENTIVARFQEAAFQLSQNQDTLTRVMTASGYLDSKKGENLGSKFTPIVEISPGGKKVGFPVSLDTNDKEVITALQAEGLQAKSSNHSFNRSDMEKMSGGQKFRTTAEELDKLLKAVHKAGGPHMLVAPKRQALQAPEQKALPYSERAIERKDSDSKREGRA